jgi:site-specific recombinase XerD
MLFNESVVEYLEYLEAVGRSGRTLESYRQRLGSFVNRFGGLELTAVTPRDVDTWLLSLRRQATVWANHPCHPEEARGLSPATIHSRARCVVMLCAFAQQRGYLTHSPAAHVRLSKPRAQRIKAIAGDDMRELVRAAKMRAGNGQCRDVALLAFMLDTGVRSGEVVSAELADLDLVDRSAYVDGKTGRRKVFFTEKSAQLIGEWLSTHPGGRWLFCGLHKRLGERMTVDSVYQMFKRRAADRGVSGRHNPHGVRHLVGQAAVVQVGIRDTQLLLGHSDINSTMVYAGADESRLREVVERVRPL